MEHYNNKEKLNLADGEQQNGVPIGAEKGVQRHVTLPLRVLVIAALAAALLFTAVIAYACSINRPGEEVKPQQTQIPFVVETEQPGSSSIPDRTTPDTTPDRDADSKSTAMPESKYDIIARSMSSVVSIDVMVQNGSSGMSRISDSGSGIIVSDDGYIVTCGHVVEGASKIYAYLDDGTSSEAFLVGTDSINDLAVIKIDGSNFAYAVFGDSGSLRVGEDVFAIGNSLGKLTNTYTSGIISGLGRPLKINGRDMTLIQTDAVVNRGNSGGGLFRSSDGALIGIVNANSKLDDISGLAFATPSSVAAEIIEDLIDHGYVSGRAYLGVKTEPVALSDYGFFQNYHTYPKVVSIEENSPADKSSLIVGDVILAVNGASVSDSYSLDMLISEQKSGNTIVLDVNRDGESIEVSVVLENRSAPEE